MLSGTGLAFAALLVAGPVTTETGETCGSAWRSGTRRLDFSGGDQSDADRLAAADRCERAGDRALRQAGIVAAVATALGVTGYAVRRSHSQ